MDKAQFSSWEKRQERQRNDHATKHRERARGKESQTSSEAQGIETWALSGSYEPLNLQKVRESTPARGSTSSTFLRLDRDILGAENESE